MVRGLGGAPLVATHLDSIGGVSERRVTAASLTDSDLASIRDFVRNLTADDLRWRFGRPIDLNDPLTLWRVFGLNTDAEIGLAIDGGKVVTGVWHRCLVGPSMAEIAVVVRSDWKRRGVGTYLLKRVIARAQDEQLRVLCGHVLRENRIMVNLATKMGFVPRGVHGTEIYLELSLPDLGLSCAEG